MAIQSRISRPTTATLQLDARCECGNLRDMDWVSSNTNGIPGWEPGVGNKHKKWRCIACESASWFNYGGARRHEQTPTHRDAVEHQLRRASRVASTSTAPPPPLGVGYDRIVGPLARVLQDVSTAIDDAAPWTPDAQQDREEDRGQMSIDWETVSHEVGGTIAPARTQAALSALTSRLDDWLLGGEGELDSDSEPEESTELGELPTYSRDEAGEFQLLVRALDGELEADARSPRPHGSRNAEVAQCARGSGVVSLAG